MTADTNSHHKHCVKRAEALEKKACAECWQYCYENGLTEKEQAEYDELTERW